MGNFNLTETALKMFYPGTEVLTDADGLPSLMVFIPKFKNSDVLVNGSDVTHPAFIVNGQEIDGFYYSKYENSFYNGKGYSLPGEGPVGSVTQEQSLRYSEAKGAGWHMGTAAEWAAIALWCLKNGYQPLGNGNYGKDAKEDSYRAIPVTYNNAGQICKVASGTGPVSWSHDNTMGGIWDMSGNLNEWQGGIRTVYGELQILANNDAADPSNPQNRDSLLWKAINAADGSLVDPECFPDDAGDGAVNSGNTVRLDYVNDVWTYTTSITSRSTSSRSCPFFTATCTAAISDAAKELLRALALLPDQGTAEETYVGDSMFWNNGQSEALMCRGGHWSHYNAGGLFYISGGNARSHSNTNIGFRASYIPGIE